MQEFDLYRGSRAQICLLIYQLKLCETIPTLGTGGVGGFIVPLNAGLPFYSRGNNKCKLRYVHIVELLSTWRRCHHLSFANTRAGWRGGRGGVFGEIGYVDRGPC
jgi:hypothetical protein